MADYDVAVVGGGLAGSVAALAFAGKGFKTALIAPSEKPADGRTTALMDQSISFLRSLGLWDEIRPHSAPLTTMQIIDGTDRLFRAPTVQFRAAEIGLEAFGYNIPNLPLLETLKKAVSERNNITPAATELTSFSTTVDGSMLSLASGETCHARLIVAADGRKSSIRSQSGIDVRTITYPQTALVLNFSHTLPHHDVSTEFHTPTGPFTQVPLPGMRSSLVWVVRPEEATALLDMTDEALNRRIEEKMQSMLGKVSVERPLQAWPLSAMTANRFGKDNIVLIGEAAHVFPPIGAQGLNLSLRDIEAAVNLAVKQATNAGAMLIGETFDRTRRADIVSRTASIDLLNRSLLSGFLPVQMLRAAGLHILANIAPLRHVVMQEGVSPGRALKNLPDFLRRKITRQSA
jgi:2-octaprenyl-6-methoxyphenol hydroxylase